MPDSRQFDPLQAAEGHISHRSPVFDNLQNSRGAQLKSYPSLVFLNSSQAFSSMPLSHNPESVQRSPLGPGSGSRDLRHHAITELAESQASDATIMAIAGHVSRQMLEHYSHVRMDLKRKALDGLATRGRISEG